MGVWPKLRAGLITLAIVIALLDGCPMPQSAKERKVMERQLGPTAAGLVVDLDELRRDLLRPLRPAIDNAKLYQRWKLFAGAPKRRFRMWIDARAADGTWTTVYRVLDDDADLLADPLGYRRVRGAWNPRTGDGPRGSYRSFVTWVAGQVFDRDPAAVAVRVRMEKVLIGPRGGFAGTGEFVYEETRQRQDLRRREVRR